MIARGALQLISTPDTYGGFSDAAAQRRVFEVLLDRALADKIFVDGDVVRVVGALDYFCAGQLCRILRAAPEVTERVLDLSEIEFIHHGALWALNDLAREDRKVRLSGAAESVQRVWKLLDLPSPGLELC